LLHDFCLTFAVAILSTGINCVSEIFRKTVLQTVSAAKRFAKSFYGSAVYDGGQYNPELSGLDFKKNIILFWIIQKD
jgi:hypothetical protein